MWHHIYPGWLVVAMYGILVTWLGIERRTLVPFALCATILLLVTSVIMYVQKKKYNKQVPPLRHNLPFSLMLISGVLLVLSHLLTNNNIVFLLMGCGLILFAGAFLVVNTLVNWPR